ncbi:hypothetical protein HDZ31DRAFT_61879 [Schizophyllum fasciatum]
MPKEPASPNELSQLMPFSPRKQWPGDSPGARGAGELIQFVYRNQTVAWPIPETYVWETSILPSSTKFEALQAAQEAVGVDAERASLLTRDYASSRGELCKLSASNWHRSKRVLHKVFVVVPTVQLGGLPAMPPMTEFHKCIAIHIVLDSGDSRVHPTHPLSWAFEKLSAAQGHPAGYYAFERQGEETPGRILGDEPGAGGPRGDTGEPLVTFSN